MAVAHQPLVTPPSGPCCDPLAWQEEETEGAREQGGSSGTDTQEQMTLPPYRLSLFVATRTNYSGHHDRTRARSHLLIVLKIPQPRRSDRREHEAVVALPVE